MTWRNEGFTDTVNEWDATYTYANAAGRLQLEAKESMKERGLPSPALADALALTFAEPVAPPGLRMSRTRFKTRSALMR